MDAEEAPRKRPLRKKPPQAPTTRPHFRVYTGDEEEPAREPPGPSLTPQMRYSAFYGEYFRPVCLVSQNAAAGTVAEYDQTSAYVVAATEDARLCDFDRGPPELFDQSQEARERRSAVDRLVAQIMAFWWALPGQRAEKISPWTVIKHRTHAQAILDRAGSGTRKKPGLYLITAPYLPSPKKPDDDPKGVLEVEEITRMLGACEVAKAPGKLAVPPRVWWGALLWFCFNTGLRIGTLLELTWSMLEPPEGTEGCWINLPRRSYKGQGSKRFWLNAWALQALELLGPLRQTGQPKIFPWPHCERWLYTVLERIQVAAGMPESRRNGIKFHGVRKCTASELSQINAMAAQIVLGHTTAEMARRHYVKRDVSKEALARLRQPGNTPPRPLAQ